MKLFIRLLTICAFGALSLSNNSTWAAEICQGVFSTAAEPRLATVDYNYQPLLQAYQVYGEKPSPESKAAVQGEISMLQNATRADLNQKMIAFEEVVSPYAQGEIQWSHFILKDDGPHPLNKWARSMKMKLGVQVVYDPLVRASSGFDAAFQTGLNIMYISPNVILTGRPTQSEGHEAIHARFAAQRAGKIQYHPKAPVNIQVISSEGISPEPNLYNHFLSFEEMLTYAFNVRYESRVAAQKNLHPPSFSAKLLGFSNSLFSEPALRGTIHHLLVVSENARLSVEKGQSLIQKKEFGVEEVRGQKTFFIGLPNATFNILMALPTSLSVTPEVYAKRELQRALQLAEFNKKYFEGYADWKSDTLIEKTKKFRSAQKEFFEQLP